MVNFISFYRDRIDKLLNIHLDKDERLNALAEVVDYLSGMRSIPEYIRSTIEVLLDSMEEPRNEHVVRQYVDELSESLCLNESVTISIVLSEENYIAKALRSLYSERIQFICIESVNEKYLSIYDYFIICGENYRFEDLNFGNVSAEKVINLYLICLLGIVGYPLTWKAYTDYKYNVEECKCFITGMSYIRDAIKPEFLRTKACNASNSSQDIYYDFMFFKDAVKQNRDIKTLIIGLAPYSLRYDLSLVNTPSEAYRLFFYYERFKDTHNNTSLINEIKEYSSIYDNIKKILDEDFEERLYQEIRICLGENDERKSFISSAVNSDEEKQMQGKYNKPYENTLLENKQILKEYLECAKNHLEDIIIFIPPYSQWYKDRWKKTYKNELIEYLEELRKDFDFLLLDMSEVYLSDDYFKDYAHLNQLGAIFVASVINEYI